MDIEINGLSKSIGGRKILNGASLKVSPGKITVLLGANGAGKSSLLRAALGLIRIDAGSVNFGDKLMNEIGIAEHAKLVGYLAQNAKPEWNMRVKDLIALGRIPLQSLGQTNNLLDAAAVQSALEKLNIEYLADKNIDEISGGELALCLLARVLAGEPKFIFADEPFNHLDIKHQLSLMRALKEFVLSGGGALVIVHDIAMAARLGDEFILMKHGEIIATGSKDIVLNDENLFLAYDEKLSLRNIENQSVLLAG